MERMSIFKSQEDVDENSRGQVQIGDLLWTLPDPLPDRDATTDGSRKRHGGHSEPPRRSH